MLTVVSCVGQEVFEIGRFKGNMAQAKAWFEAQLEEHKMVGDATEDTAKPSECSYEVYPSDEDDEDALGNFFEAIGKIGFCGGDLPTTFYLKEQPIAPEGTYVKTGSFCD